mmetsp:Transcript_11833/g.34154  ORF Transcript_11833/g.34154 Transcript_11833/m.34154 type:complete len:216 (+) Transcript_11833:125-772(+)
MIVSTFRAWTWMVVTTKSVATMVTVQQAETLLQRPTRLRFANPTKSASRQSLMPAPKDSFLAPIPASTNSVSSPNNPGRPSSCRRFSLMQTKKRTTFRTPSKTRSPTRHSDHSRWVIARSATARRQCNVLTTLAISHTAQILLHPTIPIAHEHSQEDTAVAITIRASDRGTSKCGHRNSRRGQIRTPSSPHWKWGSRTGSQCTFKMMSSGRSSKE